MGAMPPRSTGLGKRSKQKKDKRTADGSGSDDNGSTPPPTMMLAGLEERGAFAFGSCDRCGWRGPARRSRERARKDLGRHIQDKPKHADHAAVTQSPT